MQIFLNPQFKIRAQFRALDSSSHCACAGLWRSSPKRVSPPVSRGFRTERRACPVTTAAAAARAKRSAHTGRSDSRARLRG
ncbi:hypothetical protein AOLI_G00291130 [Acnodon oligacanthus]